MPRVVLLLTLIAAVAPAACGDDEPDTVALGQQEACKAVKEELTVAEIEERFGEPDQTQDFFGDTVVSYERGEVKWQFQVSARAGTFRALRVRGAREEVLACDG